MLGSNVYSETPGRFKGSPSEIIGNASGRPHRRCSGCLLAGSWDSLKFVGVHGEVLGRLLGGTYEVSCEAPVFPGGHGERSWISVGF